MRKTWTAAAISAILLISAQDLIPYFATGISERGSIILWAALLPALFSFPVGWVSDDPAQAYLAFAACSGSLFLVQSIWKGTGEDLGGFMAALIAAVLLFPAAVFGIGFATVAKSIRSKGFSFGWPSRSTFILLAFLLLPAFAVIRYARSIERSAFHLAARPISVTESQLESVRDHAVVSEKMHNSSAAHYLAGMILFQNRKFNDAAREWKTSVSLDPNNSDAHAALKRLGMDDGK